MSGSLHRSVSPTEARVWRNRNSEKLQKRDRDTSGHVPCPQRVCGEDVRRTRESGERVCRWDEPFAFLLGFEVNGYPVEVSGDSAAGDIHVLIRNAIISGVEERGQRSDSAPDRSPFITTSTNLESGCALSSPIFYDPDRALVLDNAVHSDPSSKPPPGCLRRDHGA